MKFALCQELFEGWEWSRQCQKISELGYTGVEVAPFTLGPRPTELTAAERFSLRQTASQSGLEIIGLHWLLAKTTGLHLTTADASMRRQTVRTLQQLGDLCADLGGSVMVFGSPQQRSLQPGVSRQQAFDHAVEVFRDAAPSIADRGVSLLIEPLTTKETDFINSCAEGLELIKAVDHPAFALHQDVKAMLGEGRSLPELIHEFRDVTRHFHVNDSNLLGPGMGETDFAPIFAALRSTGYDGWISVEVFDYSPGAEYIARTSIENMQRTLAQLT